MAPSDIKLVTNGNNWTVECVKLLPDVVNLTSGLILKNGSSTTNFSHETWGISYPFCESYCNTTAIPLASTAQFQDVSQAFTAYLFPWLALTAQLPYQAGALRGNFLSFFMDIGSPALVTYSLTLTTLNGYRVRRHFSTLKQQYQKVNIAFLNSLDHIVYILAEAQQAPLRASESHGWLSSLIVLPRNRVWWKYTRENLERTRRGPTFSLVAQVAYAVLAWIFVTISAFQASLGLPTVALQISSGSVWIWMLPVIGGWVTIGTQSSHDTIRDALEKDEAQRVLTELGSNSKKMYKTDMQKGIAVRSGLTPPFDQALVGIGISEPEETDDASYLFGMTVDLRGDEALQGPIFNYARLFTWYRFSSIIIKALQSTMRNIEARRSVPFHSSNNGRGRPSVQEDKFWDDVHFDDHLEGSPAEVAKYCGLATGAPQAYAKFKEMRNDPSDSIFWRMLTAGTLALVLQWGTTGAAIVIAYLTPVRGLGCRSGSYIIYGVAATLGWLSHLFAMVFSHKAMVILQENRNSGDEVCAEENKKLLPLHRQNHTWPGILNVEGQGGHKANSSDQQTAEYHKLSQDVENRRSRSKLPSRYTIYSLLFIFFHWSGRLLVIANGLWLIASSMMEVIGVYDNCWCNSNHVSLGDQGWVLMFKGAPDLKTEAKIFWAGGVTLSAVVTLGGFALSLTERRSRN